MQLPVFRQLGWWPACLPSLQIPPQTSTVQRSPTVSTIYPVIPSHLGLAPSYYLPRSAARGPKTKQKPTKAAMGLRYNTYLDCAKIYGCADCKAHLADHDDILSRVSAPLTPNLPPSPVTPPSSCPFPWILSLLLLSPPPKHQHSNTVKRLTGRAPLFLLP